STQRFSLLARKRVRSSSTDCSSSRNSVVSSWKTARAATPISKRSTRWRVATFEHSDNNLPNWPRRAYADGPFGQIHFQMLGQGAPLLLLHQAPMTSSQFDSVYEFLAAQGVQAIGIDMPGFGMSDPTPFTPTISDYA